MNSEIENVFADFAKIYSLTREDIEYIFLEVIADSEKAKYAIFVGNGVKLFYNSGAETYKTLSTKKINFIIEKMKQKALEQSLYNLKFFLQQMIKEKKILFARFLREEKKYYICEVFIDKYKPLKWCKVILNKTNSYIPKNIKYFPIRFINYQGKEKINIFIVKAKMMDIYIANFHLIYFIKNKLKIFGDFNFKVKKCFFKENQYHLIVYTNKTPTPYIIKYIQTYFSSFNTKIFLQKKDEF